MEQVEPVSSVSPARPAEPVMEVRGLTKTYGKNRGIKDVNLSVKEGEVFGFLGPNGAGKTTMIRTLLGFMRPTGGSAQIFGHDIERDSVAVRSMVGNLPGEFALEDRMNGERLLKLFARLRGVQSLDYAYELADRINADLKRPMRRLSRGNKQKIGLIQAMFHRPPLLILDEPTGGLDPLVQEEFLRIIGETREEGQDRLLLLAHLERGREGLRPGRDHPRRRARQGRDYRHPHKQVLPARDARLRQDVIRGRGSEALRGV